VNIDLIIDRSAPPEKEDLPEVMTTPLTALSATVWSMMASSSAITSDGEDVHGLAGHIPGDEGDTVCVGFEL
jgi:hypothetical protein